jgi:hypothetical protein
MLVRLLTISGFGHHSFYNFARAYRWQRMLESGEYATAAELAEGEDIGRGYVCRVRRLTFLAPDIVEWILDGRPTAGLAQFPKPFPEEWKRE